MKTSSSQQMPNSQQMPRSQRMPSSSQVSASPRFVVLEGLDGCGKSTLAAALAETLGATLLSTPLPELARLRDEVDGVLGERGMARTLWYAAQVAAVSERVGRLLREGRRVVLDRYWMSTLAYAEGQGTHLELPEVLRSLTVPDVTLLIQVPHTLRVSRLRRRGERLMRHDREFMSVEAEARLLGAFRRLGRRPAAGRFCEVPLDDEPVAQDVWKVLRALEAVFDPGVDEFAGAKVLRTLEAVFDPGVDEFASPKVLRALEAIFDGDSFSSPKVLRALEATSDEIGEFFSPKVLRAFEATSDPGVDEFAGAKVLRALEGTSGDGCEIPRSKLFRAFKGAMEAVL